MRAGQGPRALWAVFLVSFAESALLPLPVDAVTVPVMLADRRRIWRVVLLATLASILGGIAGYLIGWLLYKTLVVWLIELYGWQESFAQFTRDFREHGTLIVAVGAISPIPYKLVAIACGVERLDFGLFLLISIIGRGLRFGVFGLLLWWFGPPIRRFLDRNARLVGWIVLVFLVVGFFAVEWFYRGAELTSP